jgi:hypothetical protein
MGVFSIRRDPNSTDRWLLYINNKTLGSYVSPAWAAEHVYIQTTGLYEWDKLDVVLEPTDLTKWTKGTP